MFSAYGIKFLGNLGVRMQRAKVDCCALAHGGVGLSQGLGHWHSALVYILGTRQIKDCSMAKIISGPWSRSENELIARPGC